MGSHSAGPWVRSAILVVLAAICSRAQEGTAVFLRACVRCHSPNSDAHAPMPEELSRIPWQGILKSLESGTMKAQGEALSADDRRAVARYLGAAGPAVLPEMKGFCAAGQKPASSQSAWNGWGVDDANSRFQPGAPAGLAADQVPSLKLEWAFGMPNGTSAYSQPTVWRGRVIIGSNDGTIYSLDAHTGCIYWRYQAKALVRAAAVIGPGPRAYIGDLESNFYAIDVETGKLVWQKKLDDQPYTRITGTAKIFDGRLYVPIASQEENAGAVPQYNCCRFRGNLVALEAADGKEVWRTYTTPAPKPTTVSKTGVQFYGPSGATIWSSPTIDVKRNLVYVTTGNGYSAPEIQTADAIMAIDLKTGAIRWSKQAMSDMFNWDCGRPGGNGGNCPEHPGEDVDFGSSAILVPLANGRDMLVAGQKAGIVYGFDPDHKGEIVWQTRLGKGGKLGGILWGMAAHDGVVFAPLSDFNRSEPAAGGGLFALDAATGKVVWHTPPPTPACLAQRGCNSAQMAPPSATPGIVFSASMDGHIRAYSMAAGKIVWDYDAAHEYTTINGMPANGGSFSATGPTIVDGMLYTTSGYAQGMPGNVLLAFSVRP
ncbi:MAG TPA: PQQ-binding-like beta-propeller repeat protein [Bryobacteraceae bacterium]|nr:PQQ-binding-like beta-propeller repeat protein [Bryobacteraceae bacterium]